jgi:RHS repeat-associated protein
MGTNFKFYLALVIGFLASNLSSQITGQLTPALNGGNIKPKTVASVIDNDPVSTMYIGSPKYDNVLTFEIDRNAGSTVPYYQTTSWTATVNVIIRYYTSTTAFTPVSKSYTLNFDASRLDANNLLKVVEILQPPVILFKNKIEIEVVSLTVPPSFPTLQNAFNIGLTYKRSGVLKPNFLTQFSTVPSASISGGVFKLGNIVDLFNDATSKPILCDEFDVEWTFIDDQSSLYTANLAILNTNGNSASWNSKFINYSRVTIPYGSPILKLPAIYNSGTIVYRIRQVYYDALKNRITGKWIESHRDPAVSSTFNILNKAIVPTNYSGNLNWTSSISFAEEGKHKDVVTYFDGAQRDRQSVTYDNSSERPIIAETYYDKEGRKSAAILPAPHLSSSEIKFYPNFNQFFNVALREIPYDADAYSYLPTCATPPIKLSVQSGASHYYSPFNSLKNNQFNQFIPDAEGYPLTVSEYTNDNTGRIRRQTGVGAEFQFDKGKYTEYLYGKPSSIELDRLFGTDVGNSSHYFKNVVIDPNGQQSITYTDLSGKTIATALEGNAGNNALVNVPNNNGNNREINLDIIHPVDMANNAQLATSHGAATLTVPYDQEVTFTLHNDQSEFANSNCKESFCSDCYYDINFTVKDNCGTNINTFNFKNYDKTDLDNNKFNITCNDFLSTIDKVEKIDLKKGENYVAVDLKIPPQAIDFYEKRYLESDLCITTLDELIKKHRLQINPMNCIRTCEDCLKLFGDEIKYANDLIQKMEQTGIVITPEMRDLAKQEAEDAKKQCKFLCNGQNQCETKLDQLKADVSIGGQYAMKYFKDSKPPVYGIEDNLSLLYKLNTSTIFKKKSGLNWKLPDPSANPKPFYPAFAGTYPDIDTLIEQWTDEMADYLVQFHPEYCYYEYCRDNADHKQFIEDLQKIEKWSEAITLGYIAAGLHPNDFAMNIATKFDPYFSTTGAGNPTLPIFNIKTSSYDVGNGKFNIFELAVIMTSSELLNKNTNKVDLTVFKDVLNGNCSGQKDAAWLVFRNLYIQIAEELYDFNREKYVGGKGGSCISINDIGICSFNESIKDLSWWMRMMLKRNPKGDIQTIYCNKKARFQSLTAIREAMKAAMQSGANGSNTANEIRKSKDSMRSFCDSNCYNTAEGWLNSLSFCTEFQNPTSDVTKQKLIDTMRARIRRGLIAVCRSSCGEIDYPSGASSVSPLDKKVVKINNIDFILLPGSSGGYVSSFQDVIELYIPSSKKTATNSTAGSCNAAFIDYPEPYGVKPHFEPRKMITNIDTCSCEALERERGYFDNNPKGAKTLFEFLNNKYQNVLNPKLRSEDFHMSEAHFNILVQSCKDRECRYLPEEIEIPYIFECAPKINCDQFNRALDQFEIDFKINDPDKTKRLISRTDIHFNKLWAGYLNEKLGINASYIEYQKFAAQCFGCTNNCKVTDFIKDYITKNGLTGKDMSLADFKDIARAYNLANNSFYTNEQVLIMFLSFRRMDCDMLSKFYTTVSLPRGGIFNLSSKTINAKLKIEFDAYFKTKLATDVIEYMFMQCMVYNKPITDFSCDISLFTKPHSPDTDYEPEDDCARRMDSLAVTTALYEYHKLRQESLNDFKNKYIAHCLASAATSVSALMKRNEFHYTLYYYGQDGNLLATVPPAGVMPLSDADAALVPNNRISGTPQPAEHIMKTTYEYNALNQVIRQTTPDGGSSRFIYDQLGRLILSQNAQQATSERASYTIYDNLGRITESGELLLAGTAQASDFIIYLTLDYLPYSTYETWIVAAKAAGSQNYVTRTYYDKLAPMATAPLLANFGGTQENLRHRIATITLDETSTDGIDYNTALHYSYDILGNVKTLVSENGYVAKPYPNQQYKTVNYDYDLVSGKVNKVYYQKSKTDQFIYRYTYDAENRIKNLFSSKDDIVYTQEVQYEYYLHGPLARVIYGDDNLQGLDYAYTLQGWLKGINASTLDAGYDMGRDGDHTMAANINSKTARDAIALTLRYHERDYNQIARTTLPIEAKLPTFGFAQNGLHNGNISSSIVSLSGMQTQGYHYTYDQLNRIVGYDVYQDLKIQNNDLSSVTPTHDYKERISYDPNGNILKYFRNMDKATSSIASNMDDLKYNYYYYPSGSTTPSEYNHASPPVFSPTDRVTNQLASVTDALGAPVLTGKDIGTQNPLNYEYDEIGNLIRDNQENMDIEWTPTGKIAKIKNNNKNQTLTFAYDPMGNRVMKSVDDNGQIKQTYYTRDAQGNPLATYANSSIDIKGSPVGPSTKELWWIESPLYGSSRIGMIMPNLEVANTTGINLPWNQNYYFGKKQFELTNHLGNVLATIKDEKKQVANSAGTGVAYYEPIVLNATDYYPFGMPMPNRQYSLSSGSKYRFGFNGKEDDKEIYGEGNAVDFGDRMYDARIGRWLKVDMAAKNAPGWTPFRFGFNNPLRYNDPNGNWESDGHFWTVYYVSMAMGIKKQTAYMIAYAAEYYDNYVHPDFSMTLHARKENMKAGKLGLGTWADAEKQCDWHGLTGGPQKDVLNDAINRVLAGNLFQLHKVGDAWAHSYNDNNGKRLMYGGTKLFGFTFEHAFEYKNDGWLADHINLRPDAYNAYLGSLVSIFANPKFAFNNMVSDKAPNLSDLDYMQKNGKNSQENMFLIKSFVEYRFENKKEFNNLNFDQYQSLSKYFRESNVSYSTEQKMNSKDELIMTIKLK